MIQILEEWPKNESMTKMDQCLERDENLPWFCQLSLLEKLKMHFVKTISHADKKTDFVKTPFVSNGKNKFCENSFLSRAKIRFLVIIFVSKIVCTYQFNCPRTEFSCFSHETSPLNTSFFFYLGVE